VEAKFSLQHIRTQSTNTKTFLEQFLVKVKMNSTSKVLAGYQGLYDSGDSALLVDVDKRFEVHRVGEWCQCREHLRVS
jgi:hypothetical protein